MARDDRTCGTHRQIIGSRPGALTWRIALDNGAAWLDYDEHRDSSIEIRSLHAHPSVGMTSAARTLTRALAARHCCLFAWQVDGAALAATLAPLHAELGVAIEAV